MLSFVIHGPIIKQRKCWSRRFSPKYILITRMCLRIILVLFISSFSWKALRSDLKVSKFSS
uniref:Putative ovule protein n=1 Tax=Solanum chacoense TaxID=4108 RepID=A0A0V0HMV2_SOLCH